MKRFNYYRRLFSTYILCRDSHINFWHGIPEINIEAGFAQLGKYYLTLAHKAKYSNCFDKNGIILLDYLGSIGKQYNPAAIAQYALGNYNLSRNKNDSHYIKFIKCADWLRNNLVVSPQGNHLWMYNFDFDYLFLLKAPWYSGLAQGEGLSVLVRAYMETEDNKFEEAIQNVFNTFCRTIDEGGVVYREEEDYWIEEYIGVPATHVLNGFISALWGIYDYFLITKSKEAIDLFEKCTQTILRYLPDYDNGFWSLYQLFPNKNKCLASPFYHRLHIAQLRIMQMLTGRREFKEFADKWEIYAKNNIYRYVAIAYKILYKIRCSI